MQDSCYRDYYDIKDSLTGPGGVATAVRDAGGIRGPRRPGLDRMLRVMMKHKAKMRRRVGM